MSYPYFIFEKGGLQNHFIINFRITRKDGFTYGRIIKDQKDTKGN